MQVTVEIDLTAEDVGQRHGQPDRLARGASIAAISDGCVRVDDAADRRHRGVLLVGQHGRIQHLRLAAVARDDAQETVGVDLILEYFEQPVERPDQPIRLVLAQLAQVEDRPGGLHRGVHQAGRKIVRPQQPVERGVRRDHRFDDLGTRRQQDVAGTSGPQRGGRWRLPRTRPDQQERAQQAQA